MNVFELRDRLVRDFADYTRSFIVIRDERIRAHVARELEEGLLWPDPIVQLNPAFEPGATIDELVGEGLLDPECRRIFRRDKAPHDPNGKPLRLHRAWELKTTFGGEVQLGERDLRGLATAAGADARPRLVVLDAAFPARLWVLEGTGLREGFLRPAAYASRQRHDEADALAERVEAILRCCDVELLATDERGAKALVRRSR